MWWSVEGSPPLLFFCPPHEGEGEERIDVRIIENSLVDIPGGTVALRDDRAKRQWQVEIAPFQLSPMLLTQELYLAVTGENPSVFEDNARPVENVSWYEAIAFCNHFSMQEGFEAYYRVGENPDDMSVNENVDGFRLPSDAEWQFAALAGGSAPRYGEIDAIAWYKENSGGQTHPVGRKVPNDFGLYDMLGNVWEWCFDLYDVEVYGTYRVFRGGGWNDPERGCLATNRRRSHPTYNIDDVGFRIARNGHK